MKKVFFSLYIKNGWSKLLSKKQRCDTRQRKYYENNKKLLRENAKNKYRNLSHKEKNIKGDYGRNRYHNISEEKKQKLKKYQKNYREAKKSQSTN